MQLLSPRADAAINRLTKFAFGDQALVNEALALFARGEIPDLIKYVETHRKQPDRPHPGLPASQDTPQP
jgi:hypothetical protein